MTQKEVSKVELAIFSLLVVVAILIYLSKSGIQVTLGLKKAFLYILLPVGALFALLAKVGFYRMLSASSLSILKNVDGVFLVELDGKKYVVAGIRVASISDAAEAENAHRRVDKLPVLSSMASIVERSSLNIMYTLTISSKSIPRIVGDKVACMDVALILWSKYVGYKSIEEVSTALDIMLSIMSSFYPEFKFELISIRDLQAVLCPLYTHSQSLDFQSPIERFSLLLPLDIPAQKLSDIGGSRTVAPPPAPKGPAVSLGTCIPVISSPIDYLLPLQELLSHILIAGATGSGKTTLAKCLILQLTKLNVPVLVFDLHGEYRDLSGFMKLSIEDGSLKINLLANPFTGYSSEYAEFIVDVFTEVLDLTLPQSVMLSKTLEAVAKSDNPSIGKLVDAIESLSVKSYAEYETKMALLRKLTKFTRGQGAKLFSSGSIEWDVLSSKPCIIDLSTVFSSELRKLLVYLILRYIYDAIKLSGETANLRLAVLLEEVEKISPEYGQNDLSIIDYLVSEARKFGVCLIMTAQSLSRLSTAILQNTGTKVILRQASLDDIKVASKILAVSSSTSKMLVSLRAGWAFVKTIQAPAPVLIKTHYQPPEAS